MNLCQEKRQTPHYLFMQLGYVECDPRFRHQVEEMLKFVCWLSQLVDSSVSHYERFERCYQRNRNTQRSIAERERDELKAQVEQMQAQNQMSTMESLADGITSVFQKWKQARLKSGWAIVDWLQLQSAKAVRQKFIVEYE